MGTPDFAVEVLEGLIESGYDIVAAVTQPDRPVGRKRILTPTPVKELAVKHNIPVYQPEKIGQSEELEELINLEADIIITAAYGQFVPMSLLESKQYKAINVHASLLPKYRGGAPIHYAIWRGEEETGISIIYMTKKMDAGEILSQRKIAIQPTDDVGILFDKLAKVGSDLLIETLPKIFDHTIESYPQNEEEVLFSPTISREQEQIDWQQTALEIDNHVRAFRPFPSTHSWLNGQRLKIWAGKALKEENQAPIGTIIDVRNDLVIVQCGQGTLYGISEWQESGKKRMPIKQWLNGNSADSIKGLAFEIK